MSVRPSQLQGYSTVFYCLHGLALHALTMHWRTKSARIAHHNTLTILCTRFLPKTQIYLMLRTRTPKSIPYIPTLGSVRYLITLLKYTRPCYSIELYSALIHCCGILSLNTLLEYTQYQHIAEENPIFVHC